MLTRNRTRTNTQALRAHAGNKIRLTNEEIAELSEETAQSLADAAFAQLDINDDGMVHDACSGGYRIESFLTKNDGLPKAR